MFGLLRFHKEGRATNGRQIVLDILPTSADVKIHILDLYANKHFLFAVMTSV